MKPLTGFVEQVGLEIVRIRLDTGGVLETPSDPALTRGAKVEIDYDYTTNRTEERRGGREDRTCGRRKYEMQVSAEEMQ